MPLAQVAFDGHFKNITSNTGASENSRRNFKRQSKLKNVNILKTVSSIVFYGIQTIRNTSGRKNLKNFIGPLPIGPLSYSVFGLC